jgi:hypothetical protein
VVNLCVTSLTLSLALSLSLSLSLSLYLSLVSPQMGRPTARYLHPAIPEFIADMQAELTSMGHLPTTLEQAGIDFEE